MSARAPHRRPETLWPAGDPAYRVRRLTVEGTALRVVERGDAGAPPLFLVPGWACSAYAFHANIEAILAAGRRALIVEPRGFGGSAMPLGAGCYAAPALVRHLRAILDALALPRVEMAGLSMGAGLALRLALEAPERVARLVLVDPAGVGRIPVARLAKWRGATLGARLVASLPPRAHRWIVSAGLHAIYGDPRRVRREDVDEFWALTGIPRWFEAQLAMGREYDWRPIEASALAALRVPTLLVRGGRDRLVRVRDHEALRRELPACVELLLVEGAGHAANLECPDRLAGPLAAFLGAADRADRSEGAAG